MGFTHKNTSKAETAKKLLITVVAMALLVAMVLLFNVPNPNMILITGLVVFTSLYGYPSGIICAVAMIVYSMYFFSEEHSFISYSSVNLQKMATIIFSVLVNLVFVGQLKKKQKNTQEDLINANEMLERDNIMLKEASLTDSLTGLKNRFALRKDYPGYEHKHITVMIMDIDNFKELNDTHGHVAGDYILQRAGEVIIDIFGKDCSYRYGGDEFLVICKDIQKQDFQELIDKFRDRLKSVKAADYDDISIQFSGGYVYGENEAQSDLRMMINAADEKLYAVKRRSKNGFEGGKYHRSFVY